MAKRVKTVIIGAGSAGLSALRRVKEYTEDYLFVQDGPYGTTCATTGCMPSKVLIQAAKDFHRREVMAEEGIAGTENLSADTDAVFRHVRKLRDRFSGGMRKVTDALGGERFIKGRARILAPDRIRVDEIEYQTERIIIATGSRPVVPGAWAIPGERILTSTTFFEQEKIPRRIAVVGLGVIGLELGQALARLGHDIAGFDMKTSVGGLSDPEVNRAVIEILGDDFPLYLGSAAGVAMEGNSVVVTAGDIRFEADAVLAALGTVPNVDDLGMENLGVELDRRGIPAFDRLTMQIEDLPVYIAGDANGCRPILHEALDEGFIAGKNSGLDKPVKFCRRTPLRMVFSDPQIAVAGLPFSSLNPEEVVTGSADFGGQSRAMVELRNRGMLHIYADRKSGLLLGAEMAVPEAEHLAHQLAWAIQQKMSVQDMLAFPFYHPVVEEGLREALRDAAASLPKAGSGGELSLCGCCPEQPLC